MKLCIETADVVDREVLRALLIDALGGLSGPGTVQLQSTQNQRGNRAIAGACHYGRLHIHQHGSRYRVTSHGKNRATAHGARRTTATQRGGENLLPAVVDC